MDSKERFIRGLWPRPFSVSVCPSPFSSLQQPTGPRAYIPCCFLKSFPSKQCLCVNYQWKAIIRIAMNCKHLLVGLSGLPQAFQGLQRVGERARGLHSGVYRSHLGLQSFEKLGLCQTHISSSSAMREERKQHMVGMVCASQTPSVLLGGILTLAHSRSTAKLHVRVDLSSTAGTLQASR